uniref:Uncharacterized protein n=1 Tax=Babesia bovis TaxID=5865 RepID=S6C8M6_BABBO|nr:hypothetical protein [Babesia bovis]
MCIKTTKLVLHVSSLTTSSFQCGGITTCTRNLRFRYPKWHIKLHFVLTVTALNSHNLHFMLRAVRLNYNTRYDYETFLFCCQ